MNIRFTVSKVSRNDQLKLSQSRNVRASAELFAGNKSASQIAPGICKIFSIPPPCRTISVIAGIGVFPRTATSRGENRRANWQARSDRTRQKEWKNGERLKELSVPGTPRRGEAERKEERRKERKAERRGEERIRAVQPSLACTDRYAAW